MTVARKNRWMRTTFLHGVVLGGRERRRTRTRGRLTIASALALALIVPVGLAQAVQAQAVSHGLGQPDLPTYRAGKLAAAHGQGGVKARAHVKSTHKANVAQATRAAAEQTATWPAGGTVTTQLSTTASRMTAGGLPLRITGLRGKTSATGQVRVTTLGRKAADAAGVHGVLFEATAATPGSARLSVGYHSFASALGGGWAGRLHLVALPSCLLTTPDKATCRKRTPIDSSNDISAATVTGTVTLPGGASSAAASGPTVSAITPALFALEAQSSGGENPSGAGNYSATPLSASSTWAAGGSSGSFDWSYGLDMPPAAAGPSPSVGLSYDSASVDGKTATTNNQATQLGEGFTLTSDSYIARTYGSCDDDGNDGKYDECWKYDNASLVLNGHSTQLVKDDTTGVWRLENDDASTVTHSTGADNGDQGDADVDGAGEYWTVTTGDGTKYVFGLNKLPGAGSERTNSVWTVPVYGDDDGEPGYEDGTSYSGRSLNQAWRWNLDYVVDVHGNASTYWYTAETNYYGKNGATTGTAQYARAGHLDKILYGQRSDTLFTVNASDEVDFTYDERCMTDCSSLTADTADHWPDVPFDAICADGATCTSNSPAFFTRKRLTKIETFERPTPTGALDAVDAWDFAEEFLDPGDISDTSDQSLVLDSITRTGEGGSDTLPLPPVTFTYRPLPNRVDATDDILPLSRYRIDTITSETGAITTVTLAPADCVRGSSMPSAEDDNHRTCFPQYWHINGAVNASIDWFHRYPVTAVVSTDVTQFGVDVIHSYTYADPGWHYNDDPFTPDDERTWSSFRGFGQVTETVGASNGTQSKTVSVYMRGMDGDKEQGTTATRSATVAGVDFSGLDVPDLTDADQYAGFAREQITYNGSTPVAVTVNDPWSSKTATQHKSYADVEAYYVRTAKTATHTYLTIPQSWRTRTVSTGYDSYGMATTSDDSGDSAVAGDETCTRTWYARNSDAGITSLVSRSRTVARPCSVAETDLNLPTDPATHGDVVSDTATVYDDTSATTWSANQAPTMGEPTWSGRPTGYPALVSNGERLPTGWQTVGRTTYDDSTAPGLGRPVTVADAEGHTTTTTYTPAGAGPTTAIEITNPKNQNVTTYLDPERGNTTKSVGVDGKYSESTYDALGRATATWLPNRRRILHQTANYVYAYHLDSAAPSWTSTGTLKNDGTTYNTTYTIYDSLLRPRQTQSPTPNGGRLLTDTRYDTRSLPYETFADVFDPQATPSGDYQPVEYGGAPKQTETVFDGAGRVTTSSLLVFGVRKWSTTTSYTGDSTAVTGLQGGSASRTITDALGRTVQQRQYAGTSPADTQYGSGVGTPYTATAYTYMPDGKPATVTGPDGADWSYGYDLYGRRTFASDPDTGISTTGYTDLDQVSWTKDARGQAIVSAYDELGRPAGTWSAPAGADLTSTIEEQIPANQLTAYTYDTLVAGQPATSTRYVGGSGTSGKAYTDTVTAYDSMDRPTGTRLTLPSDDALVTSGAVSSTLNFAAAYNIDGTQQSVTTPAAGGLPSEIVQTGYDTLGLPTTLTGISGYVQATDYSPIGQVSELDLGTSNASGVKHAYVTNTYEDGTDRLKVSKVTDQTHPYELQELNYSYDDAGNVTSITDPTVLGGTSQADNQCFAYDGYQRLTEAWTPTTTDCSTSNRTAANLGGASPYWTSYTYTNGGLRSTQVDHTTAGSTLHTYCYNGTQPHALTAVIASASCTDAPTQYTYDASGNTKTRPQGTGTETLTWNPEGQLDSAGVPDGSTTDTTNYVYDASGNLLIRRDTTGETVLYLDGVSEVHLKKSGTTTTYWAQRTYALGGTCVAVRTNQPGQPTLSWMAGDQNGTNSLAIDNSTQATTKRYTTPFGAPRSGAIGTWPDDKGFLGKPTDTTTGLTYVGARAYDPTTGRFISVDPQLDTADGQSLNGYAYADNNPVTLTDPTGRGLKCGGPDDAACPPNGMTHADGKTGNGGNWFDEHPTRQQTIQTWTDEWTPETDDAQTLLGQYQLFSPNNGSKLEGGFWAPYTNAFGGGMQHVCFGRVACAKAAQYLLGHMKDIEGARKIAATYCVEHYAECQKKADVWVAGNRILSEAALLFAGGDLPEIGAAGGEAAGDLAAGGFDLETFEDVESDLGGGCSFAGDTQVLTEGGKTEAIDDLQPGDKVEAADPHTGRHKGPRTVTATHINHDNDLVDLTIETGPHHTSVLHTTSRHPFWDDTTHTWTPAGQLTPGDDLVTSHNTHVFVTAIRLVRGAADMYNLTVDHLHTYYVLAGTTPILVHNSGGDDGLVTVGRWMGTGEYQKMLSTGMVQPGGGGFSYVVHPSDPNAYISSRPGSVYVEFDVPKSALIPGGRPGDYKMSDSTTIFSRLSVKKGGAPLELPEAKNIRLGGGTTCP